MSLSPLSPAEFLKVIRKGRPDALRAAFERGNTPNETLFLENQYQSNPQDVLIHRSPVAADRRGAYKVMLEFGADPLLDRGNGYSPPLASLISTKMYDLYEDAVEALGGVEGLYERLVADPRPLGDINNPLRNMMNRLLRAPPQPSFIAAIEYVIVHFAKDNPRSPNLSRVGEMWLRAMLYNRETSPHLFELLDRHLGVQRLAKKAGYSSDTLRALADTSHTEQALKYLAVPSSPYWFTPSTGEGCQLAFFGRQAPLGRFKQVFEGLDPKLLAIRGKPALASIINDGPLWAVRYFKPVLEKDLDLRCHVMRHIPVDTCTGDADLIKRIHYLLDAGATPGEAHWDDYTLIHKVAGMSPSPQKHKLMMRLLDMGESLETKNRYGTTVMEVLKAKDGVFHSLMLRQQLEQEVPKATPVSTISRL